MKKRNNILFTCTFMMCLFCLFVIPVSADTDGTELNVLEPSKLEIQLGHDWSGVQFQLKTDVGIYPEKITVGEDGILRLEIGGSSTYILTCLNSEKEAPASGLDDMPNSGNSDEKESVSEDSVEEELVQERNTGVVAGIPISHLLLFCGGLLVSVGTLIGIRMISSKNRKLYEYDDEEEDD